MQKNEKIKEIFQNSGGILPLKKLRNEGVSWYYLKMMLENGEVELIKRGVYKLKDYEVHDFVELINLAPKGVICLHSSALFYGLSTFIPIEMNVAIPKKSKIDMPAYPPIKLFYWDDKQYKLGINQIEIDNCMVSIYDKEKTVCDLIRLRNKIGLSDAKEVLKEYLSKKERNIDKLVKYSKILRIRTVMDQYLTVLL